MAAFGMTSSPQGSNPFGMTSAPYSSNAPRMQGVNQQYGASAGGTAARQQIAANRGNGWTPPQQPQAAAQMPQAGYQPQQAQAAAPPPQMNVQGSIQPGTLYTPQQTQQSVNLARANAAIQGNPAWLQKQHDRRGVSRSAGTMAAITPEMAQYQAMGAMAGAEIPFADEQANAQFGLQGQQGQEAEINSLSRMGMGMQNIGDTARQANQSMLIRMMGLV